MASCLPPFAKASRACTQRCLRVHGERGFLECGSFTSYRPPPGILSWNGAPEGVKILNPNYRGDDTTGQWGGVHRGPWDHSPLVPHLLRPLALFPGCPSLLSRAEAMWTRKKPPKTAPLSSWDNLPGEALCGVSPVYGEAARPSLAWSFLLRPAHRYAVRGRVCVWHLFLPNLSCSSSC